MRSVVPSLLLLPLLLGTLRYAAIGQTAVDFYLDLEAGTNGQPITTNLLTSRTHTTEDGFWTFNGGAYHTPPWGEITSGLSGFTVVSNSDWAPQLRSPVSVGGTVYNNSNHSRALAYSLQSRDQSATWNFASGKQRVSMGYYYAMARGFSLNPVYIDNILSTCMWNDNAGPDLEFDIMGGGVWNLQAHVNVHSQAGGPTEAGVINIATEKVYWITQLWDAPNRVCQVEVYDPDTWTKVGDTSSLVLISNLCTKIAFGDIERELGSNDYAVTNTFGNIIMDWTTATFPLLLPAAPTNVPVPPPPTPTNTSDGLLHYAFTTVPLWDVSGSYQIATNGSDVELTLSQDPGGRITGSRTEAYDANGEHLRSFAPLTGRFFANSASAGIRTLWRGSYSGTSNGLPVLQSAWARGTAKITPSSLALQADALGKLCDVHGNCAALRDDFLVPLPAGMNGRWDLALDVGSDGPRLSGTAHITLSNGRRLDYTVTGAWSAAKQSATLRLKDSTGAAGNYLFLSVQGQQLHLVGLKGRVLGQRISFH